MVKNFYTLVISAVIFMVFGMTSSWATIIKDTSGDVITDTNNNPISDTNPSTPMAPVIQSQPASVTVRAPATATFTVSAIGYPVPAYQWMQKASGTSSFVNISGATSSSYTTPATTLANSATQYQCIITNSAGSVTSNAATLTVYTIPNITAQPASQTVIAPLTVSFSVSVTGAPLLTYQWMQQASGTSGFTPISGATSSTYGMASTTLAMSANQYECVVSNAAGSVTSSPAILTVNPSAPNTPTMNTPIAGNGFVSLSWTTATGATNYTVQYGTSTTSSQVIPLGNVTSFTVTGLSNNTSYNFAVLASNIGGSSVYSNVVSATPAIVPITLSYTYDDLNRLTNEQGISNVLYSYDELGNILSDFNAVSGSVDTTLPSIPLGLTATVLNSRQVNLTWNASTDNVGVFGYIIYRNGYKVATTTLTSLTDLNLVSATTYSYFIQAMDAAGNVSGASTTVTLKTI
ncbi:MAG: immunoglobulin domain-containing protein [Candidatus Omnitrophica bacterium]|nr:immunoglobulin domain-containing protein [Candidatus Omnitrophota bacterium]